jgi:hypothetical protein
VHMVQLVPYMDKDLPTPHPLAPVI